MVKFKSFVAVLVSLWACGIAEAAAQQNSRIPERWTEPGAATQQLPELNPVTASLLDAPVNRTEYALGPGDVLDLAVFGELNRLHRLLVTPEGTVVIPSVGVADVLGLNLDQAQARVRDLVLRYYRNVGVNLTLSQIRNFKVFVVGDVPVPGVQTASAATRVSEVVALEKDTLRIVLPRNIVVRRSSGDTLSVDLARFRQLGDLSSNPTLREGDAVMVPVVDRTVQVSGRVAFPGPYEYRNAESLAELLYLANAAREFPSDASDTVRVSRNVNRGQQSVYSFSRAEAVGEQGRGFLLQPFDAVYVAQISDFGQQHSATVQGQVRYPGSYPIQPDVTTVRDLVEMAGGFVEDASLTSASLRRRPHADSERRLRQLRSMPPELLTSHERRVLQAGSQSDDTHVVIDFERLFVEGADAFNQVLRGGDLLNVPRRQEEVAILGAVLQPGLVNHVPGQGVHYFVSLAGGHSRNADRRGTVVIRAGSGSRIDASDVRSIEPGDAIVVPFREHRDYMRYLQTTSTIVTTVTGLVLTFLAFVR